MSDSLGGNDYAAVARAVRGRRTHKAYAPEPLDRVTLSELLELARWAPNHNLTEPWRFRVVGPLALARLKEVAGPLEGGKLDRAPTLVVCSAITDEDPLRAEEDLLAVGCAAYIVLLGAHARGLAGYWRTPALLRDPRGRAAVGLEPHERFVALLYLGKPCQERTAPTRSPVPERVEFLG